MYRESDHEEASELCNKAKIQQVKPRKVQKTQLFRLVIRNSCTWNHPKKISKNRDSTFKVWKAPRPWCDKPFVSLGIIRWHPFWGGSKLDANVWPGEYLMISLIIMHCLGW